MQAVITLLNEKGGVGKTTMAVVLASALATDGFRVLLVDADSQGHATLSVRAKRRDALKTLLTSNQSISNVAVPVEANFYNGNSENPNLWLVASSSGTQDLAQNINAKLLKSKLEEVRDIFDFIIIDTSPSISDLHLSFYIASDYIIYPTECTYMPMQGLFKSLQHLSQAREFFDKEGLKIAEVLGILPTKFSGRESIQHENLGYLKGKYEGMVFKPIRRLTDFEQSSQLRVPIHLYKANSSAAQDAREFVDDVLARLGVPINV